MAYIYKTTNLLNGKIYIGQTFRKGDNYIGSGKYFRRAVKKHGKENFYRENLTRDIKDNNQLDETEIYFIELFNSNDPDIGYNITQGGGGRKRKEKTPPHCTAVDKRFLQQTTKLLRAKADLWYEDHKAEWAFLPRSEGGETNDGWLLVAHAMGLL